MIVRNRWISTNIRDRLVHPSLNFSVQIHPPARLPETMSFQEACDDAARELATNFPDKLYLALSGGADSSHVMRVFHRCGLPIHPILIKITDNPANQAEQRRAEALCEELDVRERTVIRTTEAAHLDEFFQAVQKISARGPFGMNSVMCARVAQEKNGLLVTGDGMIVAGPDKRAVLGMNDQDVYSEALVAEDVISPFFVYSRELTLAVLRALPSDFDRLTLCAAKHAVYGGEYLPKVYGYYGSLESRDRMREIFRYRKHKPNWHFSMGTNAHEWG
jgi:hypothetical protein